MSNRIDQFNTVFDQFINDIMETFPEKKEEINSQYSKDNKQNLKRFMSNLKPFAKKIASKDYSVFSEKVTILDNINLSELWNSDISDKTKKTIIKYLQTLYVLGDHILSQNKIDSLIDNINNDNSDNEEGPNDSNDSNVVNDMMSNLKDKNEAETENQGSADPNMMPGLIGDLAKEISQEIKLDDVSQNPTELLGSLLSGEGSNTLMNIVQKVGDKLTKKISSGQVNENQLLSEAQSMMGNLGKMGGSGGNDAGGLNNLFDPEMMQQLNNMQRNNTEQARKAKRLARMKKKQQDRKKD